jgi:hypothetical protein
MPMVEYHYQLIDITIALLPLTTLIGLIEPIKESVACVGVGVAIASSGTCSVNE